MKEYLQLEGMVYKLVPIRTILTKDASPLDMGQIDADKMYAKVMKWDWGIAKALTYTMILKQERTVLTTVPISRLMNQLILEGKKQKQKNIINLAMTKMPVEYFDYYSLVEPFGGYYKIDEPLKAQQLLDKLIMKYRENLNYYGKLVLQNKLALQFLSLQILSATEVC
jgi:hypothetical protein